MAKKSLVLNLFVCFCMIFSTVILFAACNKNCVHTYSDWVVTTDYTCTTDGVKTRTCTKCNHTETETIPASHTLTHLSVDPADCTHTGTLAHDHCSVCDKNFIDGVEKSNEQLIIPVCWRLLFLCSSKSWTNLYRKWSACSSTLWWM